MDGIAWGVIGGAACAGVIYGLKTLSENRQNGLETRPEIRSRRIVHPRNAGRDDGDDGPEGYQGLFEVRNRVASLERAFGELQEEITRRTNRINARITRTGADGDEKTAVPDEGNANAPSKKAALRAKAIMALNQRRGK